MDSSYCVESFDLLKADGALKLYVLVDHKYHSFDITARCISSDWLSLELKIEKKLLKHANATDLFGNEMELCQFTNPSHCTPIRCWW